MPGHTDAARTQAVRLGLRDVVKGGTERLSEPEDPKSVARLYVPDEPGKLQPWNLNSMAA